MKNVLNVRVPALWHMNSFEKRYNEFLKYKSPYSSTGDSKILAFEGFVTTKTPEILICWYCGLQISIGHARTLLKGVYSSSNSFHSNHNKKCAYYEITHCHASDKKLPLIYACRICLREEAKFINLCCNTLLSCDLCSITQFQCLSCNDKVKKILPVKWPTHNPIL